MIFVIKYICCLVQVTFFFFFFVLQKKSIKKKNEIGWNHLNKSFHDFFVCFLISFFFYFKKVISPRVLMDCNG